jgi:NAD(P)-dependent dehydrogenase (short-subunit alcohol dehydrogenase family)
MSDLRGKVVLVTGGARGIGAATALELARRGAIVAIADRKIEQARETAAECSTLSIQSRQSGEDAPAAAFELDQANPDSVEACVAAVVARFGRIDGLFANAGTGRFSPLVDMPKRDFDLVISINLNGTFYVCQEVARCMIRQGSGGKMVLSASSGARVIADQLGAYCASKAAVVNLAKHFASELGNYRINVNAICPGVVESGMTGPMLAKEEWRNMLRRQTPAGRWGNTGEVAKLVAFLLSADADYINGEDIMIDGGSTLHGAPRWYSLDYTDSNTCDWAAPLQKYPYQT